MEVSRGIKNLEVQSFKPNFQHISLVSARWQMDVDSAMLCKPMNGVGMLWVALHGHAGDFI